MCEPHTLTYLVYGRRLYIAVGKRRRTIGPVKISSQGHLSAALQGGNARADRAEMEGTGRKERGGGGEDGGWVGRGH